MVPNRQKSVPVHHHKKPVVFILLTTKPTYLQLTYDNILTLAPDPGTAQRAKGVAFAQRWLTLEGNGRAIWGTLGNPADPYRTQVDFQGPAFRCSCPVRRQPCKHGIGLLLLFSKNNDAFRVVDELPEWVATWLSNRDKKSAKPEEQLPTRTTEAGLALAEKRRQNREKRLFQMADGLAELESWLTDLFRQGLATLDGQASSYWQELAARMVDAKLGTLARRLRQIPQLMQPGGSPIRGSGGGGSADWHEMVLAELGDIYLLVKGFQHIGQLPEGLQDDLLSIAGVNFKKEDILAQEGVQDNWLVTGQTETAEEGNLFARRTWFIGEESLRTGMLLEFAWGTTPYETTWRLGTVVKGEAVFYPSAYPHRILFKQFELTDQPLTVKSGYADFAAFTRAYAEALAANPWISPFPAFLEHVIPVYQKDKFALVDRERKLLPVVAEEDLGWKMMAMSGGRPITVFGQWDGGALMPLSAVVNGEFRLLHLALPLNRNPWSQE